MGELGDVKNLNLNAASFLSSIRFQRVDGGRCTIPGFAPSNLPTFTIPPIPIFSGIPSFSLFCGLPPFPGIPGLSLPGISIPIPPIPFIPPIPIPIPGFALPSLPILPKFDLGSINFLCGLVQIKLPVLDPFAELNNLIAKTNSFINSLNSFLNFCKQNTETITATQVPPIITPSLAPSKPLQDKKQNGKTTGGIAVPNVTNRQAQSSVSSKSKQPTAKVSLKNIKMIPGEPSSNLALYLANAGMIPAEGSIINQVGQLFASAGNNLTEDQVNQILADNNIPSVDGFVGFSSADMDLLLSLTTNLRKFIELLIQYGFLCDNPSVIEAAFEVLSKINLATATGLDVASALNSAGIPFGPVCTNLLRITKEDISRAFYLEHISMPFTKENIVGVLKKTGCIDDTRSNLQKALDDLDPLPELITPESLESALIEINPGPAIGSIKAMCFAKSQGLTQISLPQIEQARQEALLSSISAFKNSLFVSTLQSMSLKDFQSLVDDLNVPFPSTIIEMIPLLSIAFNVDDKQLTELLISIKASSILTSTQDLYNLLIYAAQIISSQQALSMAIKSCKDLKEDGFSFEQLTNSVKITLNKYQITLPTSEESNKQMANAFKIDHGFNYSTMTASFGDTEFESYEQIAFVLLSTGSLISTSSATIASTDVLQNPVNITIYSPTKVISDVDLDTLNISVDILSNKFGTIKTTKQPIVVDGKLLSNNTATIVVNDFSQSIEITIVKIGNFDLTTDAISDIKVDISYKTIMSTTTHFVPNYLILVKV